MSNFFDRQGFLGSSFQAALKEERIAIIGICGGGGHIVQQLSHMGFQKLCFIDYDILEESNLTRMVLATYADIGKLKVDIALKRSLEINPLNSNIAVAKRWQLATDELLKCKYVFSCLDSLDQREQLEMFCRKNNIVMIDIGMSVLQPKLEVYSIVGQVFISIPNRPCMKCFNFFKRKDKLEDEYGEAGPKPQVVFSNGILASNAINLFVKMVSQSYGHSGISFYKIYNSDKDNFLDHPLLDVIGNNCCEHYP